MLTDIIKTTFARLNKEKIPATPDMYRKYFCEQSRKVGLYNSECNSINALSDSLSYKNRQILKKLDIETMDQLLDFLTVQLAGPGKDVSNDGNNNENVKGNDASNLEDLIGIVELVKGALNPSVGNLYSEEIEEINGKITEDPTLISNKEVQEKLHKLAKGRSSFDRRSIVKQTIELTDITSDISQSLNKSIKANKSGSNKMAQVRTKLNNFENVDFSNEKQTNVLKNHFISMLGAIESEANALGNNLNKEHQHIKGISNKILTLKEQIQNADNKNDLDFLTNTYTKNGFKPILKDVDQNFIDNKEDYCLIFYDLDRIEKINKVFGFDAGDSVISVFAQLLKKEFENIGAVSRYGGNRFLLILNNSNLDEGIKAANGILNVLHSVKFTYRSEKIKVSLSGCVCSRTNTTTQSKMIKNLLELLQRAKDNGRDRIEICSLKTKQTL